ncbi:MAG: hypothetical protein E7265_01395 [Lachnospiraceae bacterium]|nr:hypothetical protein [Lachnospiraceae bacterium]
MRNYTAPNLTEINDIVEGVYASSGAMVTEPPLPTAAPNTIVDWDISCSYRNHNSGSHSEVAIIGLNMGNNSGDSILMNFLVSGFRLDTVKDSSGYPVSNVTETGFTIFRPGHFNPNERFEFNIQITAKDSPYHGSIGKTGEYLPCTISLVSYEVA